MSNPELAVSTAEIAARTDVPRVKEIREWIVARLARELSVKASDIDVDAPFSRAGLDSVAAVHLVSDLEEWLRVELSPTLPYEYPTATALARYLSTIDGVN
jgi:acyl carrier protein